jgi:hypothetical protein
VPPTLPFDCIADLNAGVDVLSITCADSAAVCSEHNMLTRFRPGVVIILV